MQSFLEKRLGDNPAFQDIKACQRQARIEGISAVLIGTGATYVTLKLTKILDNQPKYIPLACLGVGVCCGYIKSISVIQRYQNKRRELEQTEQRNLSNTDSTVQTVQSMNEILPQNGSSPLHSKYGDKDFFLDEKGTK